MLECSPLSKPLRITFYCPDRHIRYDGYGPDERGIGGGATVRMRLSSTLVRRGHEVTLICNASQELTMDGVRLVPLDRARRIKADVLALHSTGDKLDLRPVLDLEIDARLRTVLVDGIDAPKGLAEVKMDFLTSCSNFLGDSAHAQWGVPRDKIFVNHHGVERRHFQKSWFRQPERQVHRIAYATHPSKGLDAAIATLRLLRARDPRFELHVFGGHALWGQQETGAYSDPGVVFHGLIGQQELSRRLMECGFALYLQRRLEPFGIAIIEALAAGCITLASPVGAHGEIIHSGRNGFLVEGNPSEEATHHAAANWIHALSGHPQAAARIREQARVTPLDWKTAAAACEEYWRIHLGEAQGHHAPGACPQCGGGWLLLADGLHCRGCGYYRGAGLC